jgi:hypothetical protein
MQRANAPAMVPNVAGSGTADPEPESAVSLKVIPVKSSSEGS